MGKCTKCDQDPSDCQYALLDKLIEECKEVWDDLEDSPSHIKSCLACYFKPCRCREGLKNARNTK